MLISPCFRPQVRGRKVGTRLDDLAFDVAGRFAVQPVREVSRERIQLLSHRHGRLECQLLPLGAVQIAHVERLGGEEHDLVELREVGKEVIDSRPFRRSPPCCPLVDQPRPRSISRG